MKCPLLRTPLDIDGKIFPLVPADCLKGECAWWLQDVSLCAMKDIALELRYTQQRLADMADKMPHEKP